MPVLARIALLCLLALVAGCGAEDSPRLFVASDPDLPLSRRVFAARANEICYSTKAQLEAAADRLFEGGGEAASQRRRRDFVVRYGVPLLRRQTAAIEALVPPPAERGTVARILEFGNKAVAEVRRNPDLLVDGRSPGLAKAGRLAARFGATECRL